MRSIEVSRLRRELVGTVGLGFSPGIMPAKSKWPLGPEVCFSGILRGIHPFSQPAKPCTKQFAIPGGKK
jgi:hypothetical protein